MRMLPSHCRNAFAGPVIACMFIIGCGSSEPPRPQRPDPTKESWYVPATAQLAEVNRQAAALLSAGKPDDASALIQQADGMAQRLISVPSPTYEATVAVSDRDALYGKMLIKNRHYGWARMEFQKIVTRWKAWQPQTEETRRRLAEAEAQLAACDRQLETK